MLLSSLLRRRSRDDAVSPEERRRELAHRARIYGGICLLLTIVWAVSSRGYFWPVWVMLVLGLRLAVEGWDEFSADYAGGQIPPALARQAGISLVLATFFTLVWAVTGHGYYWPVWPILAMAVFLVVRAAAAFGERGSRDRIEVLEETRAGAVEQQESELEQIERDLHDGAQARLVALGMSLGMAEQKLDSDPEAAKELLAEARQGTREALEELRSLARGIHPPVLADRGLGPAISALADRTPLEVHVEVDLPQRPPRAVETAAYFVAAEALANAGKHGRATSVDVSVRENGGELTVEVVDDGVGGADPAGSGVHGLARRVEALDGRLEVASPPGGPTTIRAVMPCGS
jgi:signal transduction histidine kinase